MSSAPGEAPRNTPDQAVLYEERLWPSPWIWLIAAGFSSATIVMFAPISMEVGFGAAAVVAVLAATALIGLINGLVIAKAQIPSFIATLGALGLYSGLGLAISGASTIRIRDGYEAQRLAEAALRSIATGQPVDLRGGWQP